MVKKNMRANFVHIENLLRSVVDIDGDFAEIGVWYGTTFMPMVEIARQTNHKIHAVDSFCGLAERTARDNIKMYPKGALSTNGTHIIKSLIKPYRDITTIHEGFIPDVFSGMEHIQFSFVHLDVDHYQPTLDSLVFLWERMVKGGIIVCHDWDEDSKECAAGAIKDWMQDESVDYAGIQQYSSHCWFIK